MIYFLPTLTVKYVYQNQTRTDSRTNSIKIAIVLDSIFWGPNAAKTQGLAPKGVSNWEKFKKIKVKLRLFFFRGTMPWWWDT